MNTFTACTARFVAQRTTQLMRNVSNRLRARNGSSSAHGNHSQARPTDPLDPKDTKAYNGNPVQVKDGYKGNLDRLIRNPNLQKYQNPEKFKIKNGPEVIRIERNATTM